MDKIILGTEQLRLYLLDRGEPITARQVRNLADDGILTKASRNKFELLPNVQAYYRYKAKAPMAVSGDEGHDIDINLERARKAKADADMAIRKDAEEAGELVSAKEVSDAISKSYAAIKALMIETVDSIKEVADLSAEQDQEIDTKLIDGFNEIADIEVD